MIDYEELNVFTSNAQIHIESILETFVDTVKKNGSDSFIPMCIYVDSSDNIQLVLTSRPWKDKDDMYKSFSEMLFAFSAFKSQCCLFVNDVRITKYDVKEPHSKTTQPQDALNISFISKESSAVLNVPYTIDSYNNVNWHLADALTSPLSKEDPSEVYQGDMVELFYVMSHIDHSAFTVAQLLNYYTVMNFKYEISEKSVVEKVNIESNNDNN